MKKIHIYILIIFLSSFILSFLFLEKLNNNFSIPNIIEQPRYSTISVPIKLSIPKIDVDTNIEKVGMTKNGEMDVPKKLANVGWYAHGYAPGDKGSAVFDGHSIDNIRNKKLVFFRLDELAVGDDIYVNNAGGEKLHFKVVDKKSFDYDTKDTDLIFSPSKIPKLNLITCNGNWVQSVKNYDKRLVVFTELVDW